jgi:hypothetical protein
MRGPARWCVAMGVVGGLAAGCRGAPWQHVAATPDRCVQRSAIKQEIATLDAKLKKGEFPATPPVLMPARAAEGRGSGGGISTDRVSVESRAEAASASDGGASPQAVSSAQLVNTERVMDENAARDRQTVANSAPVSASASAVDPNRVTLKQASEPVPTTKPQAQARIKLLQKQLWDLPYGAACEKLPTAGSADG